MSFNTTNRKIHYWASAIAAVPLLVVIASGLLLPAGLTLLLLWLSGLWMWWVPFITKRRRPSVRAAGT